MSSLPKKYKLPLRSHAKSKGRKKKKIPVIAGTFLKTYVMLNEKVILVKEACK